MKKLNLKTRIFAGLLALMMLTALPVMAEEEAVFDEKDADILEQSIKLGEFMKHPKLYKYVSDDGTEEKWICSLEEELDGLHRTEEYRKYRYTQKNHIFKDEYQCPVEEFHYHPVGDIGFRRGDNRIYCVITDEDCDEEFVSQLAEKHGYSLDSFVKSAVAVKCTKEEYEMLKKTKLLPILFPFIQNDDDRQFVKETERQVLMLRVKEMPDHYVIEEKRVEIDDYEKNLAEFPYCSPDLPIIYDDYEPSFQTVAK